jgi:hypothetical protein
VSGHHDEQNFLIASLTFFDVFSCECHVGQTHPTGCSLKCCSDFFFVRFKFVTDTVSYIVPHFSWSELKIVINELARELVARLP